MKRVLITGASGFIGRHCLPLLVAKGYEVHALSRRRLPAMALPGVFWHEFDLLGPGCAAKLFSEVRPECLLHLAWHAVPGKFWEARENIEWVRASLEVLCAFADNGGERMVAAGSCAEYDSSAGECKEATTPLLPATLYGVSKHALEMILHASSRQTSLSSAWGRIFFLYGPYEHPSRLVAYVVQSLLGGKPALCSEGRQVMDFMHVEDVASAFVALLESAVQGPVNIGSGNPVAVRDVLREIGQQLGRLELIRFGARSSKLEPYRFWANTQRLTNEVNWTPHYDLTRGIKQTIAWWRSSMRISRELLCGNTEK
jgi:nucleoside-diphosphate-sugar epimerase